MGGILVADQSGNLRAALRGALSELSQEIVEAEDGYSALHLVCETTPQLVVAAADLPGLSGIGLCYAVRGIPAARDIGVVVLGLEQLSRAGQGRSNKMCAVLPRTPSAGLLLVRPDSSPILRPHGSHERNCPLFITGAAARQHAFVLPPGPVHSSAGREVELPVHRIAAW